MGNCCACFAGCVAGPKGWVTSKLPPAIMTPVAKCITAWVLAIIIFIASPYWGHGGWFGEWGHIGDCWNRIPISPCYMTSFLTALYITIQLTLDLCQPDIANQMTSCCSREGLGLTCFFAAVFFMFFRFLAWFFWAVGATDSPWCGYSIWAYWAWYIQLLICLPVAFVMYVCIYPSGGGAAPNVGSPGPYQKMEQRL